MKIIPRNCGPPRCAVYDGVLTTVVVEMSMLHEGASEADVVDIGTGILHDGVNVTVCVDVSIIVDTTGCGMSTDIISSSVN